MAYKMIVAARAGYTTRFRLQQVVKLKIVQENIFLNSFKDENHLHFVDDFLFVSYFDENNNVIIIFLMKVSVKKFTI